jgi:hypothetical protein
VLITDHFAWAHVPKTGGNATTEMLWRIPGLLRYADSRTSRDLHVGFGARRGLVRDRCRVANIRRLPSFVTSYFMHVATYDTLATRRQPYPDLDVVTRDTTADRVLADITAGGELPVQRWLRTEHLVDDVLAFVAEFQPLDDATIDRVRSVGRINPLPARPEGFTGEQLATLYAANPAWAAIEAEIYGSLVTASP